EPHALTFAAGLAAQGFKPVVALYSTFLQRGYDQIIHDIALQKLPVIIAIDRAGLVGEDGPTHHGTFDLSFLRCIPNLTVMAPRDEWELASMLKTALQTKGPAAIRYPRGPGFGVSFKNPESIALGKAEILRPGRAGALLGIGIMSTVARQAAEELAKEGLELEVVNARFVKPLDEETIAGLLKRHKKVITLEENVRDGGFGSAVMELAQAGGLYCKIKILSLPDEFIEAGPRNKLLEIHRLDRGGVIGAAREFFAR
ncbi:MAG: transketolase C-terminal domain-containing protein, partial [Thermodesulfobacteriota bacterium]